MAARIGLISDTHGLLREQAKKILQGCQQIIHAGDVDSPEILEELRGIAPTTAVRGNMDFGGWAQQLKSIERLKIDSCLITVVHNINHLDLAGEQADVVIFGHSHRFTHKKKGRLLLINPGSAGPRRFSLPITMAVLTISKDLVVEKIVLENKK